MIDIPDIDDCIYELLIKQWNSPSESMLIHIYAQTKYELCMFITQHSLNNVTLDMIKFHKISDPNIPKFDESDNYLQPYQFGSNKDDTIYTIYTTEKILSDALSHVGEELSQELLMGSAIIKNEFGVIKLLNEMIESLPYICIHDYQVMCTEDSEIDDDYIYNRLFNESTRLGIQPITIEAYVEEFTSLLILE